MSESTAISLFAEIDRDKTRENVDKFFNKDFDKALNLSRFGRSEVTSPSFDPTGVSASGSNHTEEKFLLEAMADMTVERVFVAIARCSQDTQIIIKSRYLRHLPNYVIYDRLGISDRQYYKLQSKAQIEFAQRFDSLEQAYPVQVYPLAVYEGA